MLAALAALAAGCGSSSETATDTGSDSSAGGSLVLYSSQHEPMTEGLVDGFEAKSGASVQVRYGEDGGLASQIEQEGEASPADVFLAENSPPLEALAANGLLSKVEKSRLVAMLRPEQISLCDPAAIDAPGVRAAVRAVAFHGHDALAELELQDSAARLQVRTAGHQAPAVGEVVAVTVEGSALALPTGASPALATQREPSPSPPSSIARAQRVRTPAGSRDSKVSSVWK